MPPQSGLPSLSASNFASGLSNTSEDTDPNAPRFTVQLTPPDEQEDAIAESCEDDRDHWEGSSLTGPDASVSTVAALFVQEAVEPKFRASMDDSEGAIPNSRLSPPNRFLRHPTPLPTATAMPGGRRSSGGTSSPRSPQLFSSQCCHDCKEILFIQRRMEWNLDAVLQGQLEMARTLQEVKSTFGGFEMGPFIGMSEKALGSHMTSKPTVGDRTLSKDSSSPIVERPHSFSVQTSAVADRTTLFRRETSFRSAATDPRSPSSNDYAAPSLPLRWPTRLRRRHLPLVTEPLTGDEISMSRSNREVPHGMASLSQDSFDIRRQLECHVLSPHSATRIAFDILGISVLFYDLIVTPYVLAWQVPYEGAIFIMACATALYWFFDIFLNFITGYYDGGNVERSFSRIAARYFRTWFFPDLVVSTMDLVSMSLIAFDDEESGTKATLRIFRLAKIGRQLRILNLLRTARWIATMEKAAAVASVEGLSLLIRIVMVLWGTVWFTHLLACLWYAIGTNSVTDTGARWLDDVANLPGDPSLEYKETGTMFQYLTALHWVAAQLSLGTNDVRCVNSTERIFNIVVIIFALFCGSTLVSLLSAVMVAYQMSMNEQRQRLNQLRTYFRENDVERKLARRLHHLIVCRLHERDRLEEDNVEALQLLSSALRSELRASILNRHVVTSPLFKMWSTIYVPAMRRLADEAAEQIHLRAQDQLFTGGEHTTKSYVLVSGQMLYSQDTTCAPVESLTETDVFNGAWMSQSALWSEWIHTGTAEAIGRCTLVALKAEPLINVVTTHRVIHRLTSEYARHFCARLMSSKPPHSDWPTDLYIPFTDFADITLALDEDVQQMIGVHALALARSARGLRRRMIKRVRRLQEEVETGASVVTLTESSEVVRVVSVVVVKIQDEEGRLLVQVGKPSGRKSSKNVTNKYDSANEGVSVHRRETSFHHDDFPAFGTLGTKLVCQLPGGKAEHPDLQGDLESILDNKLAPFADRVRVMRTEEVIEERDSKDYDLRTRYLRKIVSMYCSEVVPLPVCEVDRLRSEKELGDSISDKMRLLSELQDVDIHVIDDDGKRALYAWLTPLQFELLSSSAYEETLNEWSKTVLTTQIPDHSFI